MGQFVLFEIHDHLKDEFGYHIGRVIEIIQPHIYVESKKDGIKKVSTSAVVPLPIHFQPSDEDQEVAVISTGGSCGERVPEVVETTEQERS